MFSLLRSLVLVGAVSGLGPILHQGHEQIINYRSPSEVFGPVNNTMRARGISGRAQARLRSGDSEYYSRRTPENCSFPFSIMIHQDSTGSFERSFFEVMGQALIVLFEDVLVDHPGTTFSIVSYQDKPINTLGERRDYCFRPDIINSANTEEVLEVYHSIKNGGGYDWPENQYGSLLACLESPTVIPWMQDELSTPLIIHITDSGPHFDGDDFQKDYPQLSPYANPFDETQHDQYCTERYYPDPWSVANAMVSQDVYFTSLIFNAELYQNLALDAWAWFNSLLGQPESFVTAAEADSLSWLAHFISVINAIRGEECGPMGGQSTTTPSPAGTTTEILTAENTENSSEFVAGSSGVIVEPSTEETTDCQCPSEDPCCRQQPEFVLAILKRPSELDIHMK